jgi:hypothetical protein
VALFNYAQLVRAPPLIIQTRAQMPNSAFLLIKLPASRSRLTAVPPRHTAIPRLPTTKASLSSLTTRRRPRAHPCHHLTSLLWHIQSP